MLSELTTWYGKRHFAIWFRESLHSGSGLSFVSGAMKIRTRPTT